MNPQIQKLLSNPELLLEDKPYLRRVMPSSPQGGHIATLGQKAKAKLPSLKYEEVSIEELLQELDPHSHKVLFDENIPSITAKTSDGNYLEIEYKRMASPFQQLIRNKQVLHLCANKMSHILLNSQPTKKQQADFIRIKQGWDDRNMDGLKTDMVSIAKGESKSGLLFYFDYKGRVKARTLSYSSGYRICTHTDDNGDHILESVYYAKDGVEYIDSYDDTYMYRLTNDGDTTDPLGKESPWRMHEPVAHGFDEIPLITKSCRVAWDNVQSIIEIYEVNANIFAVIQKRYGWGILYIKGNFGQKAQRIAGSVILNDNSLDENADAKFLTPPTPQNMIEYLDQLKQEIQLGAGTTFLLPKDIKISGDTSGVAIQLTQELDMETAHADTILWQNVASKMMRLFKQGLAVELVATGEDKTAITDFASLSISSKFIPWRPQSDVEYNNMLIQLKGAGGISCKTLIEKNTLSTPDEAARISEEAQAQAAAETIVETSAQIQEQ